MNFLSHFFPLLFSSIAKISENINQRGSAGKPGDEGIIVG